MIDVALKYGYDTPESFIHAFTRFHGATPTQVKNGATVKSFLYVVYSVFFEGISSMVNNACAVARITRSCFSLHRDNILIIC